ncbi:unnamed protein product [Cuscuta campestris]|uniref:Uncharacterized protein n=1 Tax=Cuscuta campestris TaxID=132261 RepID=A0A484KLS0_9ASTE|nr:unnamed protein product [Cuscuta campestris]
MLGQTGHTSDSGQWKRQRKKSISPLAQSSDTGKGQGEPRAMHVGQIGQEWATRLLKSKSYEKSRMEVMMVVCQKEAEAARLKASKMEEKLLEQSKAFWVLYAKHNRLLKAAKEADDQAQEKIAELEEKAARSEEDIAKVRAELEKE